MSHDRFHHDGASLDSSRPVTPAAAQAQAGFMACPAPLAFLAMGAGPSAWASSIYQMAYDRARAALQPSRYTHLLKACPN